MYGGLMGNQTMKSLLTRRALCPSSLDVLEIDEIGAVGFEEAAPAQASFEFLQGEVSSGLFFSGAQDGFAVAAGGVEQVAGVIEDDAVIFARWNFVGDEAFRRCRSRLLVLTDPLHAEDAPIFQLHDVRAESACPCQILVGEQNSRPIGSGLRQQTGKERLRVEIGAQGRLIEEQDGWAWQQRSGEGQAALRGGREFVQPLLRLIAHANLFQCFADATGGKAMKLREKIQVAAHGEAFVV